jgi:hypothetical protein
MLGSKAEWWRPPKGWTHHVIRKQPGLYGQALIMMSESNPSRSYCFRFVSKRGIFVVNR